MCIDYDAENWLGNPTREEMLQHHNKLIEAENELLRQEVDRYRKNQAKLIDMVSALTIERDTAAKELSATKTRLSETSSQSYERMREISELQRVVSQRDAIMRGYGVPEVLFGSPRTES
jgi:regulator of replication initiation timing